MKIGIFEAGLPNPEHDAGSSAVVELCILVQSLGHDTHYFYTGDNPWGRSQDFFANNIPFSKIPTPDNQAKLDFLQEQHLDAAIISRPGPAAQIMFACKLANIPIIYFGHDIHHIRLARGNEFLSGNQQVSTREITAMRLLEHNIWKESAAVIYPSKEEADIVNNHCRKNHALEIPIYDLSSAYKNFMNSPSPNYHYTANNLLFVGGAHHMPNYDGIFWFAREVLPHLHIDFSLSIVGDWPEKIRTEIMRIWNTHSKNNQLIEFKGRLPNDELYTLYKKADIAIAPLRYGAGVKRKVVEALAFSLSVLGTSISFEGVDIEGLEPYLLAETDGAAYANKITALLTFDKAALRKELDVFSIHLREKYSNNYRKKILEKALALL